jgi:AcrR family transcriptional regulator
MSVVRSSKKTVSPKSPRATKAPGKPPPPRKPLLPPKPPSPPKQPRAARRDGRTTAPRGDETRALILEVALGLFRKEGFDGTTMRAIANEAGIALGSAYYYFPSKEAIVLAYYEETQNRVVVRVRGILENTNDLAERLSAVFQERIDAIANDRRLLSALFRSVGNPDDDLSVFSAKTQSVRMESIELFEEALAPSEEMNALSKDARSALGHALWMLQLASILYMVHDDSPKLKRTRKLMHDVVGLLVSVMPMMPILASAFGDRITSILHDAALLRPRRH